MLSWKNWQDQSVCVCLQVWQQEKLLEEKNESKRKQHVWFWLWRGGGVSGQSRINISIWSIYLNEYLKVIFFPLCSKLIDHSYSIRAYPPVCQLLLPAPTWLPWDGAGGGRKARCHLSQPATSQGFAGKSSFSLGGLSLLSFTSSSELL